MDLSRRWIETPAQPSGSYNSCRFEMLLHHLPLSIAGRMVIHVKRVSYIEPLSILYRSEYGLSRAISKKRNFRIFYGRATLFASESLQDIRLPENTSNRRRIKQLRSRRKLHRSDFPPLPPPESGEHCRQFSTAVTESPAGQTRLTGWFRRSGECAALSGAAIPPPSENSKDRSPETARW